MSATIDREQWRFVEQRGPYAEWSKVYPDGRVGGVLDWGDGEWTFALGQAGEPEAGGRCTSLEEAKNECDRRWKQSQN